MEPAPAREYVNSLEPGEFLEQTVEVKHPDLVADSLCNVCGMLGVLCAEEVCGLVGSNIRLVDGSGQHTKAISVINSSRFGSRPVASIGQNQSAHQ